MNKMGKMNKLRLNIFVILIVFVIGVSLVSAGNLFGGNRNNGLLNDGTSNGGFLSNILGGNNNNNGNTSDNNIPTFQEYDFEASGVDLDSLEWDVDPPVWHSADEIKIKADDGNYYSLQEALDYGLIKLPIGKVPQGVLINFSLPQGSPEWYDSVCPAGYGRNKKDQYADYVGEFTITNPFVYEGGVYDFSCSIGDKPAVVTRKVQLSENYTVIVTVKEPKVERIGLGSSEVTNGEDKYSYLIALEENKLKFRVTRPSSCRNNLITNLDIPICLSIGSGGIGIAGLTPGGISSSTNDEIVFEPLGVSGTGYCSSGGSCNGLPTSEVGGCTGSVCGCSLGRAGCYSSINQIPGLPQPDQGSSNDGGLNCNLLPSININLPEQTCQNDQCPVYTVTSGILGGFKEKEIYNWQKLKCSVRATY